MYYIKKYPISLTIILIVIYLSFFKPPSTELDTIPNIDKVVHICMYMGMSGMLWIEFLRTHRQRNTPIWHAWVGAYLCPVMFSGIVELLQEYCTTYRGGDWRDFAANSIGATIASLIGYFLLRPRMLKSKRSFRRWESYLEWYVAYHVVILPLAYWFQNALLFVWTFSRERDGSSINMRIVDQSDSLENHFFIQSS